MLHNAMPVEAVGDELLGVGLLAAQRALGALRADDRVTRALVTRRTYKQRRLQTGNLLKSFGRLEEFLFFYKASAQAPGEGVFRVADPHSFHPDPDPAF